MRIFYLPHFFTYTYSSNGGAIYRIKFRIVTANQKNCVVTQQNEAYKKYFIPSFIPFFFVCIVNNFLLIWNDEKVTIFTYRYFVLLPITVLIKYDRFCYK